MVSIGCIASVDSCTYCTAQNQSVMWRIDPRVVYLDGSNVSNNHGIPMATIAGRHTHRQSGYVEVVGSVKGEDCRRQRRARYATGRLCKARVWGCLVEKLSRRTLFTLFPILLVPQPIPSSPTFFISISYFFKNVANACSQGEGVRYGPCSRFGYLWYVDSLFVYDSLDPFIPY